MSVLQLLFSFFSNLVQYFFAIKQCKGKFLLYLISCLKDGLIDNVFTKFVSMLINAAYIYLFKVNNKNTK